MPRQYLLQSRVDWKKQPKRSADTSSLTSKTWPIHLRLIDVYSKIIMEVNDGSRFKNSLDNNGNAGFNDVDILRWFEMKRKEQRDKR